MVDQIDNAVRSERQFGMVTVIATGAGPRLVLAGEVDIGMHEELYAAVEQLEEFGMPIEVHTRDVTFIDSSVMAMLARLIYRCHHQISMIDPPAHVRFLLRVTELENAVEIVTRSTDAERVTELPNTSFLHRSRVGCQCSGCSTVSSVPVANPARQRRH